MFTRKALHTEELARRGFCRIEDEDTQSAIQSGFDRFYQKEVPLFARGRDATLGAKCTVVLDPLTGHVWMANDHVSLHNNPFNYQDVTIGGVPIGFQNIKFQKKRLPPS